MWIRNRAQGKTSPNLALGWLFHGEMYVSFWISHLMATVVSDLTAIDDEDYEDMPELVATFPHPRRTA